MANEKILVLIKKQFEGGAKKEDLKKAFMEAGYSEIEIDEAFYLIEQSSFASQSLPPQLSKEEELPSSEPEPKEEEPKASEIPQPIQEPQSTQKPPTFQEFQEYQKSQQSQQNQPVQMGNLMPQSIKTPPKRKINKKAIIIAFLISFFLIGGVTAGYFYYVKLQQKNLAKIIENLANVKSLEYTGEISVDLTTQSPYGGIFKSLLSQIASENSEKGSFSIKFSGSYDKNDLKNQKSSVLLEARSSTGTLGQDFYLVLEERSINKIIYLKISDTPYLALLGMDSLSNQWIKVDTEELQKQYGIDETTQKISSEKNEEIKKAFVQSGVIKVTSKLPGSTIDGVATDRYKFTIDKTAFKNLVVKIYQILGETPPTKEELQSFEDALGPLEFSGGEIWIGKKDSLPHKISLNVSYTEENEKENLLTVKTNFTFKNFNKSIQVDIPAEAKDYKEVLNNTESFYGSQSRAKDARLQADMNQLRTASQMYFSQNNTYAGMGGNSDYEQIVSDIQSQGGVFEGNINNNGQGFCAITSLSSGGFWCIDSELVSKKDADGIITKCKNSCVSSNSCLCD